MSSGGTRSGEPSRRHLSTAACGRDILLGVAVEDIEGVIDRIPEEFLLETP